jgi:hypothetical protein
VSPWENRETGTEDKAKINKPKNFSNSFRTQYRNFDSGVHDCN